MRAASLAAAPIDRELEAFGHADVPVHDDAEMQADSEFAGRFATGASSLIERFHAGNGVLGCFQGGDAGHLRRSPVFLLAGRAGGENGERGTADEAQHLAAVIERRAGGGLEELIEGGEKRLSAEHLRQRRGVAQIAEPDDGPDVVPIAALDQTLEHALARCASEIGIENVACGTPQGTNLGDTGKGARSPSGNGPRRSGSRS